MNREDVIKGLGKAVEVFEGRTFGPMYDMWMDATKEALALLKAQEPVKPTRYQQGNWFKTWRCGACGGTLVFRNGEDKPKYCIDCGRAVKYDV